MAKKTGKKDTILRRLAATARQHLGRPYVYGAWTQEAPLRFDCSSFIQFCFKSVGIDLPRLSIDQARLGRRVRKDGRPRPGDLIFLRGREGRYNRSFPEGIGHVILVTGPDEVIHARSRKRGGRETGTVTLEPLDKILRRKDITVIKRLI